MAPSRSTDRFSWHRRRRAAARAALLVAACAALAAPSAAHGQANVAIFTNPTYVDTGPAPSGEATNLSASLTAAGHAVTPFTGITAAELTAALAGKDAIVVPEQEPGPALGDALDPAARQILRDFVTAGGNFVTFGQHRGILDAVFGFSIGGTGPFVGVNATKQAAAADTPYVTGPSTLAPNSAVYGIDRTVLPAGARVAYQATQSGTDYAVVILIPYGGGTITYFGWDWFNSNPPNVGGADGGWQSMLSLSTTAPNPDATPTPTPTPAPTAAPAAPAPPAPTPAPTPAPPPPCVDRYAFELVEITTGGCLGVERAPDGTPLRVVSGEAVRVNGIPLPAPRAGQRFVATLPTRELPGGRIQHPGARVALGPFVAYDGSIDWRPPAVEEDDEATEARVATLAVPSASRLAGLRARGSIDVRLGRTAAGAHYATFPVQVELPPVFKSGPDAASGLTGTAVIRVDRGGVRFDGMKLVARHAWIGKLQIEEVCLSYVPAGGQAVEACEPPELDGRPYVTCNEDTGTDRWDGNAVIVLPTKSETRLAAFGGLSGGRLSRLGGFVDNLGRTVPLATEVYLNRVGVGLCLTPPPFKLRGDVGVSILPTPKDEVLGVNGYFVYSDPHGREPWSLEIGGSVEVFDRLVGTGYFILRPTGSLDFGLAARFSLFGVASVDGRLRGWVETRRRAFNLDGEVRGCLGGLCSSTELVASSTGLSGCATVATIVWWIPRRNHDWRWWAPWRIHWVRQEYRIKAGFGHRWNTGGVQLFGGSCHLGNYRAARTARIAADGTRTVRVAAETPVLALRVPGTSGSPDIVVRGPEGERLAIPVGRTAVRTANGSSMVRNPSDGSTAVLLVQPSPGEWSIDPAPGETIDVPESAPFEPPAEFVGTVRRGNGGQLTASMTYALPRGATLSLVETGRGVQRTLAADVQGEACPAPARPDGVVLVCHRMDFRPAAGPGGRRQLRAVVERGGVPLSTTTVARFTAPRQELPGRARLLRVVRRKHNVVAAWRAAPGAERHSVTVALSTGTRFGRLLEPGCESITIGNVRPGTRVSVRVVGVREDMETGRHVRQALPPRRTQARRPTPLLRTLRVPRRPCG